MYHLLLEFINFPDKLFLLGLVLFRQHIEIVFRNSSDARKFQDDNTPISQLKYDIDTSTLGTQSCNGHISVDGSKTIYLGFENERVRYTNYLWIEAIAVVPKKLYFKEKYTIQ